MAVTASDPTTLFNGAAECFLGLTPPQHLAIQTYLLAVIAGGSTDPRVLLTQAACFVGLNDLQLRQLCAYLLCNTVNP